MFEAQLLRFSAVGGTAVYSPWMHREGDNLRADAQLIEAGTDGDGGDAASADLQVRIFHKDLEDTGNGVPVGSNLSLNLANSLGTVQADGLKELVRYRFSASTGSETPGDQDGWIMFRILTPVWFDAV